MLDFEKNNNGVYVDVVKGVTWKNFNPVRGGLIVGEVNLETVSQTETNNTFIFVR